MMKTAGYTRGSLIKTPDGLYLALVSRYGKTISRSTETSDYKRAVRFLVRFSKEAC